LTFRQLEILFNKFCTENNGLIIIPSKLHTKGPLAFHHIFGFPKESSNIEDWQNINSILELRDLIKKIYKTEPEPFIQDLILISKDFDRKLKHLVSNFETWIVNQADFFQRVLKNCSIVVSKLESFLDFQQSLIKIYVNRPKEINNVLSDDFKDKENKALITDTLKITEDYLEALKIFYKELKRIKTT
jgi:hypothetical protein